MGGITSKRSNPYTEIHRPGKEEMDQIKYDKKISAISYVVFNHREDEEMKKLIDPSKEYPYDLHSDKEMIHSVIWDKRMMLLDGKEHLYSSIIHRLECERVDKNHAKCYFSTVDTLHNDLLNIVDKLPNIVDITASEENIDNLVNNNPNLRCVRAWEWAETYDDNGNRIITHSWNDEESLICKDHRIF